MRTSQGAVGVSKLKNKVKIQRGQRMGKGRFLRAKGMDHAQRMWKFARLDRLAANVVASNSYQDSGRRDARRDAIGGKVGDE